MIIILFSIFIGILSLGLWLLKKPKNHAKQRYSIIIACKNEAENLPSLFKSLLELDYAQSDFEIIFCDDNSSDRTFPLLQNFCLLNSQYHALRLDYPLKGKKQALQKAIAFALYEYLVFTDADCIVPKNWLSSINEHLEQDKDKQADMLIGYSPEINNSSFRSFTYLVTATMYACTTGLSLPFSCTGRHLIVKKQCFNTLKGYKGIEHIPSGDDKLLLNKFYKAGKKITYMYYPKVKTLAVEKQIRKNQDLRRYGKFHMSRLLWQSISILIAGFFIYLPYDLLINKNFLPVTFLYLMCLIYILSSVYLHKESFRLSYFFYIIIYPYFLIYKSIKGIIHKWTWK